MEESLLHSELPENRDNLEMARITKESAAPCVSLRPEASPRNVVESGCRQRQIYGDNGTFFRKLSATTILSTGMFLYYSPFKGISPCLKFLAAIRESLQSIDQSFFRIIIIYFHRVGSSNKIDIRE